MRWMGITALVLSACGRVGFDALDVLAEDGGPGESDTVEIVAYSLQGVGVLEGALVWSNRRDGTVDDVARTDAAGTARLRVEAGGTVSVFDSAATTLQTIAAVEPGDTLTLGVDGSHCGVPDDGVVEVAWEPVAGATSYEVIAGCSNDTAALPPLVLDPALLAPPSLDLVLRAYDGTGQLLASATRANASLAAGAMHTLGAGDWRPGTSVELGVANVPANAIADVSVVLSTSSAPTPNADAFSFSSTVSGGGEVRVTRSVPVDATRMTIAVLSEIEVGRGEMAVLYDVPLGMSTALAAPPVPDGVTWHASTGEVSWSLADEGPADSVDAIVVFDDVAGEILFWSARVPPDVRSFAIPMTPPELVLDFGDAAVEATYVITSNFEGAASYREARGLTGIYWMIFAAANPLALPALQQSGSFGVSIVSSGGQ